MCCTSRCMNDGKQTMCRDVQLHWLINSSPLPAPELRCEPGVIALGKNDARCHDWRSLWNSARFRLHLDEEISRIWRLVAKVAIHGATGHPSACRDGKRRPLWPAHASFPLS